MSMLHNGAGDCRRHHMSTAFAFSDAVSAFPPGSFPLETGTAAPPPRDHDCLKRPGLDSGWIENVSVARHDGPWLGWRLKSYGRAASVGSLDNGRFCYIGRVSCACGILG